MRAVDLNPRSAQPGWPPVVVAGGYQTGVVLMRNLERRGLSVSCVECSPRFPCFKTIYGKAFHCPNPDDQPDQWLQFMVALSKKLGGRPVLIASSDRFVTYIAQYADELDPHFRFARTSVSVQDLLATKRRQYDIAANHGFPVPRTACIQSADELMAFGSSARFPCLLKPIHFREWQRFPAGHLLSYQKVTTASSLEELLARYRMAAGITPEVVVQEIIEGPDTAKLVYLSCYGRNGDRLGACILQELRTYPIYFGSASVVTPIADPETDAMCDRFLRAVGYVGLCEFELKRDSRDGCVKMIEANPRFSMTADAAPYIGVDLGWLHYLDLIGETVHPVQPAPPADFRHIVLQRDFATFRSYVREGLLTWGDILRCYRPPVAFFDFDLRDWRVTAGTVVALAKSLAGSSLRRLFRKGPRPA
jgi:D-aspartate ligase